MTFEHLICDIERWLHLAGPPHGWNEEPGGESDKLDDARFDEYVFRLRAEYACTNLDPETLGQQLIAQFAAKYNSSSTTPAGAITSIHTLSVLLF